MILKNLLLFTTNYSHGIPRLHLGGTGDGEEIVAGFGLVDWVLPTTQKSYSYPLITIPLEMGDKKMD